MTDYADIVRQFIEQPWDDPTVGNGAAVAALDALVAERDEARRERDASQERITTYAQEVVDRLVAAEAERDEARREKIRAEEAARVATALMEGAQQACGDLRDRAEAAEAERDEARRVLAICVDADRITELLAEVARLKEALLAVDDALVNGDAPDVGEWHRNHSEESAEDCLVCVVRAALAPKEDG